MTGIQTSAGRGPRARLLPRLLAGLGLAALGVLAVTPAALAASTQPSLSFQPSTWTAGPIASGTTTAQTFTLTNTGGEASGALAITVSGSAAFSVKAGTDSCTGTSLGPDKSCTVTVVYAPASNAESDTATLHANGVHASTSASLTGTSTNPNPYAKSASACAALGGTFSTDPSTNGSPSPSGGTFVWSCNNGTSQVAFATLADDCLTDVGGAESFNLRTLNPPSYTPWDSTCYKS